VSDIKGGGDGATNNDGRGITTTIGGGLAGAGLLASLDATSIASTNPDARKRGRRWDDPNNDGDEDENNDVEKTAGRRSNGGGVLGPTISINVK